MLNLHRKYFSQGCAAYSKHTLCEDQVITANKKIIFSNKSNIDQLLKLCLVDRIVVVKRLRLSQNKSYWYLWNDIIIIKDHTFKPLSQR